MDMMAASLRSAQAALSIAVVNKSMAQDVHALVMLGDMLDAIPAPQQLATPIGSMDIRI